MSRTSYFVFLLALWLAALSAGCSVDEPPGRAGLARAPVGAEGMTLLWTLPEGDGPGEVRLRHGGEEIAAAGPSAAALGPSGVLHVADTLAGRVVRVRPGGRPLPPLACPWVEDVAVDRSGRVFALSRVGREVRVFAASGEPEDRVGWPETMRWVGGLAPLPGGGVALRTAYQESVPLDAEDLHRGLGEGVPGLDGRRYRTIRRGGDAAIERVEQGSDPEPRWTVATRHAVAVADLPGSLVLVGATEDGEVVVDVQDVVSGSPVEVERRLRRYGPEGDLRAEVEVPRGTYAPPHATALAADGTALVLRPTGEGVEVWAWPSDGGAP